MRYLRKPFDYANAGVYSDPGEAWDGAPRIFSPSDSMMAQGATPNTPIPAELRNGIDKVYSDALALQAHAALQNWSAVTLPQIGTDVYQMLIGMQRVRAYGVMTEAQRQVIAIGYDSSDSNKPRVCLSNDGSKVQSAPVKYTIPAFTGPVQAVAGAAGEVILINNSVQFAYSTTSTTSWTNASFSGPPTLTAAHYIPSGSAAGYYIVGNNSVYISPIISFVGASQTVVPTPLGSSFQANNVEFADNGSVILLAGGTAAGDVSVWRSTNAGASFSNVLNFPLATALNVAWSAYWGLFFVWGNDGQLYTSSDGSAWSLVRFGLTPAAFEFLSGSGSLQAIGPAIVKATTQGNNAGIVYSFDQGLTWNYHYFDDGATGALPKIRTINNRLYATAENGKTLFRSGQLGFTSLAEI